MDGENLGGEKGKWAGCATASNGLIYGIPAGSKSVLRISPQTGFTHTFGNLNGNALVGTDNQKWWGGASVGDCVYGAPMRSLVILKVCNTSSEGAVETVDFISVSVGSRRRGWFGFLLATAGSQYSQHLFGIPHGADGILVVDPFSSGPVNDSNLLGFLDDKFSGGVVVNKSSTESSIVLVPWDAQRLLRINTSSMALSFFGDLSHKAFVTKDGNFKDMWHGAVLSQNGFIYAFPARSKIILRIDSVTDNITAISVPGLGGSETAGAVHKWTYGVAVDNVVYGIHTHDKQNKIDKVFATSGHVFCVLSMDLRLQSLGRDSDENTPSLVFCTFSPS